MMKYPMQIESVKRIDKTLGIDSNLCLPTKEEYANDRKMPLEMHSGFSRFTLSILENKESVKANIPAEDIKYIYEKTGLVQSEIMKYLLTEHEEEKLSIAYTQKLFDKKFSNRTPAEILTNNPEEKENLLKTRKFLESNLTKYKTNQSQINAIDDALKLFEAGKLKDVKCSRIKNIEIYNEPTKIPNANKVDKDDLTFVYSISIIGMPDKNYPFAINIMNGKAPVIKDKKTGKITAELSKLTDKKEMSFLLSEKEWSKIINRMCSTLKNFEMMNFKMQYELAKENSYFK